MGIKNNIQILLYILIQGSLSIASNNQILENSDPFEYIQNERQWTKQLNSSRAVRPLSAVLRDNQENVSSASYTLDKPTERHCFDGSSNESDIEVPVRIPMLSVVVTSFYQSDSPAKSQMLPSETQNTMSQIEIRDNVLFQNIVRQANADDQHQVLALQTAEQVGCWTSSMDQQVGNVIVRSVYLENQVIRTMILPNDHIGTLPRPGRIPKSNLTVDRLSRKNMETDLPKISSDGDLHIESIKEQTEK